MNNPAFDFGGLASGPMPRTWTISMAILIVCLIASMVIAVIKL